MMCIRVVRCIRDIVSHGERKCLRSFVKLGIKLFNLRVLGRVFFLYLFSGGLHHVDFSRDKQTEEKKRETAPEIECGVNRHRMLMDQ
jgi:hypothetical protein